jgi:hypothetical protein
MLWLGCVACVLVLPIKAGDEEEKNINVSDNLN